MRYVHVVIEADPDGWHAIVLDMVDDVCLYITDSHERLEDAEREARMWILNTDTIAYREGA